MSETLFRPKLKPMAVFILGLSVCLWGGQEAIAQLTKAGQVELKDIYNPHQAPGDIVLPLPCENLKMVLRPVAIDVKGRLKDLENILGLDSPQGDGFFSHPFYSFLAAPLSLANLPEIDGFRRADVAKTLGNKSDSQIYFIGKYEVTTAQWASVMEEGVCPNPEKLDPRLAAPITNISWFEAVTFTEKYTQWLLKNAPQYLPRFAGDEQNVGFFRLPTETEWEYAARGGHEVDSVSLAQEFFPLGEGKTEKDYGIFIDGVSSPESNPVRIGRYQPNPLGIYDTVGNAAEMTIDTFKMSLGGRLHGSAGGFVRKGGSFMSGLTEVKPGDRKEIAYFNKEGPIKAKDLGFRLVLSAINVSRASEQQIKKEWEARGRNTGLALGATQSDVTNPLTEIERLLKLPELTEREKEILERLLPAVKIYSSAAEERAEAALNAQIKSMLNSAYGIREISLRRNVTKNRIDILEAQMSQAEAAIKQVTSAADKKEFQKILADFTKTRDELKKLLPAFEEALKNQFGYYKQLMDEAALKADRKVLAEQLERVGRDIKGQDIYHEGMRKCFGFVSNHLKLALQNRSKDIKRSDLEMTGE